MIKNYIPQGYWFVTFLSCSFLYSFGKRMKRYLYVWKGAEEYVSFITPSKDLPYMANNHGCTCDFRINDNFFLKQFC